MSTIGYGTNIQSLRLQRLSAETADDLSTNFERLSSGMRIDSAADDPGGQALAAVLSADEKIAGVARLNIEQGISLLASSENDFSTAQSILAQMGEIANQSANGTLTSTQRGSLQKEFDALRAEIGRLRDAGQFNGIQTTEGGITARAGTALVSNTNDAVISADGRYLTYLTTSGALIQRDLTTNTSTTIASSAVAAFSVTPLGDKIAFSESNRIKTFDRLSGTVTAVLNSAGVSTVSISDDGSKVAYASTDIYDGYGVFQGDSGGNQYVTSIDLNTGIARGDNGTFGFSGSITMNFSPSGEYLAASARTLWTGEYDVVAYDTSTMVDIAATYGSTGVNDSAIDNTGALYIMSQANLDGTNSGGHQNIFKSAKGGTVWSNITRFTGTNRGGVASFFLGDGGNSLVIIADGNPFGTNALVNNNGQEQVFKSTLDGTLTQLTGYNSQVLFQTRDQRGDGFSALSYSGGTWYLHDVRPELSVGISTGNGLTGRISTGIMSLDSSVRALYDIDVDTQRNARIAVDVIKSNINAVNLSSSKVSAGLSRLTSARTLLADRETNLNQALSRVRDVDTAESVATATRLQILQDAQVALRGQTDRLIPTIALSLLQEA